MEKELLRQAFNAGVEYQKQFECKLAESYDKPNFDEWYDTVVLPQANVIKSVCEHPYEKVYQSDTECYCENCGHDFTNQTVL